MNLIDLIYLEPNEIIKEDIEKFEDDLLEKLEDERIENKEVV